jgi:predicted nucleic acid-binding protein
LRIALDTNVLVYAEGIGGSVEDRKKSLAVHEFLETTSGVEWILPLQVIGELHHVLSRKSGLTKPAVRARVEIWLESYESVPAGEASYHMALVLATKHQFAFWDALILSVAANAGCRYLLSEDMSQGFLWHGTTIANPFTARGRAMSWLG